MDSIKRTINQLNNIPVHPGFSIDCVIVTYHNNEIMILLDSSIQDAWKLPGGFMYSDEKNAEVAAMRITNEITGINSFYLRQFQLFTDIDREDDTFKRSMLQRFGQDFETFYMQRFITIGYIAFVRFEDVTLNDNCVWVNWNKLPKLYSDHNHIISRALQGLQVINEFIPFGYGMLPEKFIISELRCIHEALLGGALDRRNFQRKVLSSGYIIKLDEQREVNTYPKPTLFTFDKKKLNETFGITNVFT